MQRGGVAGRRVSRHGRGNKRQRGGCFHDSKNAPVPAAPGLEPGQPPWQPPRRLAAGRACPSFLCAAARGQRKCRQGPQAPCRVEPPPTRPRPHPARRHHRRRHRVVPRPAACASQAGPLQLQQPLRRPPPCAACAWRRACCAPCAWGRGNGPRDWTRHLPRWRWPPTNPAPPPRESGPCRLSMAGYGMSQPPLQSWADEGDLVRQGAALQFAAATDTRRCLPLCVAQPNELLARPGDDDDLTNAVDRLHLEASVRWPHVPKSNDSRRLCTPFLACFGHTPPWAPPRRDRVHDTTCSVSSGCTVRHITPPARCTQLAPRVAATAHSLAPGLTPVLPLNRALSRTLRTTATGALLPRSPSGRARTAAAPTRAVL